MDASGTYLIVVGVDGSQQSLSALRWAVDEARLRRGKVRVITAWHYPSVPSTVEDSGTNDSFHSAERVQADALKTVNAEGVDLAGLLVRDLPSMALLDAAKDADLLIVGSRGHGGFSGLLLGSVSSQVAHHAPCPVLIFRH
ncbi:MULTISPECIES: universal stress protein [Arthrobacter]|uniref:Universal stress protein n=1 Tax=Arthrobacter terricola TaxID=2547396 RepID=A0A4R5L1S7_9MICC|nr:MULTISPECIES: universal stress protein [Arthrobacter]MBT8159531.1 universal stress protein [Arthrobacter sp. GN70]TDG01341.1 universal stress protein [Arthrobacter terricola]